MGGAFYNKYIDESLENDHEKLLNLAMNALKKQINLEHEPVKYKISIHKVI